MKVLTNKSIGVDLADQSVAGHRGAGNTEQR